jgi:hypothetical protein
MYRLVGGATEGPRREMVKKWLHKKIVHRPSPGARFLIDYEIQVIGGSLISGRQASSQGDGWGRAPTEVAIVACPRLVAVVVVVILAAPRLGWSQASPSEGAEAADSVTPALPTAPDRAAAPVRRNWTQPVGIAAASLGLGLIFLGAPLHQGALRQHEDYLAALNALLASEVSGQYDLDEWRAGGQAYEYTSISLLVVGAVALVASVALLLYEPVLRPVFKPRPALAERTRPQGVALSSL